jgi:hypothetical protein
MGFMIIVGGVAVSNPLTHLFCKDDFRVSPTHPIGCLPNSTSFIVSFSATSTHSTKLTHPKECLEQVVFQHAQVENHDSIHA